VRWGGMGWGGMGWGGVEWGKATPHRVPPYPVVVCKDKEILNFPRRCTVGPPS